MKLDRSVKFGWSLGLSRSFVNSLLCALLFIFAGQAALGQSGRREAQRGGAARQPAIAATEAEAIKISLLVTYSFSPEVASWGRPEDFVDGLMERLEAVHALKARRAGRLNRREATERAKEEKESFVIWVHLEERQPDPRARRSALGHLGSLVVDLNVLKPATAETRHHETIFSQVSYAWTSGKKDRQGSKGDGNSGPQARVDDDAALQRAGRETADRVLKAFELPIPLAP
ncbi:MAG TPA: hypothetical protein VGB17_04365 [Pyrinomonadaceae bacterium]